ncbi:hypothetical protein [Clostridium tagluense]|uniref:hypothetical protein n=1 Tax=Clostridium tagluense TaxID=360422 RepID=UPI001CF492F5|nr:hypothetical protein [Clostridium tagluense]MCB2300268.1 hypothetical protein [Clostridium tagluense]
MSKYHKLIENHKLIKITLEGLKEDFAWVEIKCNIKNELHTVNYIDYNYTINHRNADYKKVVNGKYFP